MNLELQYVNFKGSICLRSQFNADVIYILFLIFIFVDDSKVLCWSTSSHL